MSISVRIRRAVRAVGSPFRNYFNGHFEMTKEEIRRSTEHLARAGDARVDAETAQQLAELSNVIAESQLHQARVVAELRREVERLRIEVADLGGTTRDVSAAVAASTLRSLDAGSESEASADVPDTSAHNASAHNASAHDTWR